MAELSDVLMMKALEDDNDHDTWGSAGFLWVILIFLFFLAFNGGGLFGNRGFGNGAAVVAMIFLRLSVMSSRAIALLRRRFLRTVIPVSFPSISWAPRCSLAAVTSRRPSSSRIS